MPAGDRPSSLQPFLDRLAAGDSAAANDIIAHCLDRLKTLTHHMLQRFPGVHRWEETSDVFHDVVVKLAVALREIPLSTPADFLQLAACQIRRRLIDLSRKCRPTLLRARADGDDSAAAPDPAADADDPHELAVWEEFHARIAALPEGDRRLFDLLYYQGLTQPEAADLLRIPLRTLKRYWQQARERIGRLIGSNPRR